MNPREKAMLIAECLDNKKGKDIVVLNIEGLTSLCDYFVVASAGNAPQINAMVDEVGEKLSAKGFHPAHKEGKSSAVWVLMDYGDVVVHIFQDEMREFYGIERLWSDAEKIEFKSQTMDEQQ